MLASTKDTKAKLESLNLKWKEDFTLQAPDKSWKGTLVKFKNPRKAYELQYQLSELGFTVRGAIEDGKTTFAMAEDTRQGHVYFHVIEDKAVTPQAVID